MNIEQLNQVKQNATLLHDQAAVDAALNEMARQLVEDYADKKPIFLVVMNGGLVIAGKLLPLLSFPAQVDYCHASRYRGEMEGGDVYWRVEPHLDLAGRHVVVVDDILDEGYTLLSIIENCQSRGVASIKTLVLIEKLHQRKAIPDMRADYCELTTPDKYVFGCGMDYNQYWRNTEAIYIFNH